MNKQEFRNRFVPTKVINLFTNGEFFYIVTHDKYLLSCSGNYIYYLDKTVFDFVYEFVHKNEDLFIFLLSSLDKNKNSIYYEDDLNFLFTDIIHSLTGFEKGMISLCLIALKL